jgi:hypothetical protein
MSKTKNGKAVDVKKAAAGDKSEPNGNGKVETAKVVKIQTLRRSDQEESAGVYENGHPGQRDCESDRIRDRAARGGGSR